jgi:hypothetical protein
VPTKVDPVGMTMRKKPKIVRTKLSTEELYRQLRAFEAAHPGVNASNYPDAFRDEHGELQETEDFFEISSLYAMLSAGETPQ